MGNLRQGILSTAGALGMDPIDLATIISYETAGTFDPTKRGPTTQWGQHRGLIQFGEPQAKQYGVDWSDPQGSQLGPDGAVAKYFKANGYEPGMGLLDAYSIVNAGGPGRYGRSDANNGGAPGTVSDKVNNQMADHRAKGKRLMNGDIGDRAMDALGKPRISPGGGQSTIMGGEGRDNVQGGNMSDYKPETATGILGSLFPSMTADRQDRIISTLAGMTTNPNMATIQNARDRMGERAGNRKEYKQEQKSQQQANKTAQYIAETLGRPDLAQAVMQGVMSGGDAYRVATQPAAARDTKVVGSALVDAQTGEKIYGAPDDGMAAAVKTLEQRAALGGLAPGSPEYKQFMINGGASKGMALSVGPNGEVTFTQGNVGKANDITAPASADSMINTIDGVLNDPALDFATGWLEWTQNIPGTAAKRFGTRVAQLNGQAFLQAFESLKGGGPITDIEGSKATAAAGRLDSSQSPEDYRDALKEAQSILKLRKEKALTGGTIQSDAPGVKSIDMNGTTYTIQQVD